MPASVAARLAGVRAEFYARKKVLPFILNPRYPPLMKLAVGERKVTTNYSVVVFSRLYLGTLSLEILKLPI